jgi:stage II sporulation protein D
MSQVGAEGLAEHGYSYQQILAYYYTGTAIGTLPAPPTVSVLLQGGKHSIAFAAEQAVRAGSVALRGGSYVARPAGQRAIAIYAQRSHHTLITGSPVTITSGTPFTLAGTSGGDVRDGRFDGALELVRRGPRIEAIDLVGLEDYVAGVVPVESSPSWQPAELDAQTIAARSYALTTQVSSEFDLYGDTRSQAYGGVGAQTPSTDAAVSATAGQVVTYGGTPVTTYYFASSGGETEDVQNAFPDSAPEPWLVAVSDPYDVSRFGPITLTLAKAKTDLGKLLDGTLEAITVTQRGVSPRIVAAQLVGSAGTTTVTGGQLAGALHLPSTWACFAITDAAGNPQTGWDSACAPALAPPQGASGPSGASGQTGST